MYTHTRQNAGHPGIYTYMHTDSIPGRLETSGSQEQERSAAGRGGSLINLCADDDDDDDDDDDGVPLPVGNRVETQDVR